MLAGGEVGREHVHATLAELITGTKTGRRAMTPRMERSTKQGAPKGFAATRAGRSVRLVSAADYLAVV
jgi:hypothetical protein